MLVSHAKLVSSTYNVDVIRYKRIYNEFLKRVPVQGKRVPLGSVGPGLPSFDDLDHAVFTHVRHVEVVRPCSLGERKKAI